MEEATNVSTNLREFFNTEICNFFEETPPKLRPTSSTTSPSHSMEAEVDKLVVQYKRENLEQEPTAKRLKVQKRSFAPRKTNEEIEKAKLGAIPQKTLQVGVACMHALVW